MGEITEERGAAKSGGIAGKLIGGAFWLSAARMVVNGLSAGSMIVLAWFLMPADFGLVAIASTIAIISVAVLDLSLNQMLIRHEGPTEEHYDTAWTLNVLRGLILAIGLAAIAHPAAVFYGDLRLVDLVWALAAGQLVQSASNPRRSILPRNLVFWHEVTLSLAEKFVNVIAAVGFAIVYQSYWAIAVGTIAGNVTFFLLSYIVYPKIPRPRFVHAREFFSFGVWTTGIRITEVLSFRFEFLLIGRVLSPAMVGFYSMGANLAAMPSRELSLPLMKAVFPGLSRIKKNPERLTRGYETTQSGVMLIALPLGFGAGLLAQPVIPLLLGERWLPIIPILQILGPAIALNSLATMVQPLGMSLNRNKRLFVRNLQMLVVRVAVIGTGLWLGGLYGVVWGRALCGVIGTFANMLLVREFIGLTIRRQFMTNLRPIVGVVIMSGAVLGVQAVFPGDQSLLSQLGLISVTIGCGALVYPLIVFGLWRLAGKPDTAERTLLGFGKKLLRRKA